MNAYEGSGKDRKRDKKSKTKEGSAAEEAQDKREMRTMMGGNASTAADLKRKARAARQ